MANLGGSGGCSEDFCSGCGMALEGFWERSFEEFWKALGIECHDMSLESLGGLQAPFAHQQGFMICDVEKLSGCCCKSAKRWLQGSVGMHFASSSAIAAAKR